MTDLMIQCFRSQFKVACGGDVAESLETISKPVLPVVPDTGLPAEEEVLPVVKKSKSDNVVLGTGSHRAP